MNIQTMVRKFILTSLRLWNTVKSVYACRSYDFTFNKSSPLNVLCWSTNGYLNYSRVTFLLELPTEKIVIFDITIFKILLFYRQAHNWAQGNQSKIDKNGKWNDNIYVQDHGTPFNNNRWVAKVMTKRFSSFIHISSHQGNTFDTRMQNLEALRER